MPFIPPLLAAGGGALAGFATFLQSGTFLAGLVNMGLQAAPSILLGLVFGSKVPAQSVQIETSFGAAPPRSVILGTVGLAGRQVYRNFYGKGNRAVADVRELCDWRVSAINRVRFEGNWTAVTESPDGEGWKVYAGTTRIQGRLYPGLPSQTASDYLILRANPTGRWTADHRGDGISYVEVANALDVEALPRPWDAFFEVQGWFLYDWRKDDTAGGDGDDRWDDPSTWTGRRDNPVLQMYGLSRGFWLNDQLIVGKGVHPSRLPLAQWTIAANICDEIVEGSRRYSSSIIARRGKGVTHAQNMQPLLTACAGSWVEDASGEFPIVGANQAIVATITDEDLMVDEDLRFSKYRSRSELINTVTGSFCDPENFYEQGDIAVREDAAALANDGELLAVSIDYTAVTSTVVADRLADIALRASRYQANGEICVRPKFVRVKPGQWIRWNSARYGDRNYQVVRKRLGAIGTQSCRNVYWTLQEVGEGVFDPTEFITTSPDRIEQGAPDYQTALDDFVLTPVLLENAAGTQRAAFRATWDTPLEDTSVKLVEFEYWPVGQPEAAVTKQISADLGKAILADGVMPSTETEDSDYRLRYRLFANPPRTPVWSAEYERTADLVTSDVLSVDFDDFAPDVLEFFEVVNDDLETLTTQVGDATAGGLFKMEAGYDPDSGWGVRIGARARVTLSDALQEAGLYIEAKEDAARIILFGDQVIIATESEVAALFENGTTFIDAARIRHLTAANINAGSITADRLELLSVTGDYLALESVSKTVRQDLTAGATITNAYTMMAQVFVPDWDTTDNIITGMARIVAPFNTNGVSEGWYHFEVRRATNSGMSSPTVIANHAINVNQNGIFTSVQIPFSDAPAAANDYYYAVYAKWLIAANQTTTLRSIHVTHIKR